VSHRISRNKDHNKATLDYFSKSSNDLFEASLIFFIERDGQSSSARFFRGRELSSIFKISNTFLGNKNYANIYAKCLRSIKKYPIPFISAKELVVLDGFGDKICEEVGQLHQQYAAVHNISALVDHYRYCQKVFLLDFRGV
jgi:hypothetical protein